jgi:hypothetical protein
VSDYPAKDVIVVSGSKPTCIPMKVGLVWADLENETPKAITVRKVDGYGFRLVRVVTYKSACPNPPLRSDAK